MASSSHPFKYRGSSGAVTYCKEITARKLLYCKEFTFAPAAPETVRTGTGLGE